MAETTTATPLTAPVPDPHNVQLTKYYIFNETGNIMVSSTAEGNAQIEKSVVDQFSEVAVFYAAMTRAISQTPDPKSTATPKASYSIYDYDALSSIISGSGLFVHVTEEDISYETESVGVHFSTELIEGLLGLATGAGALSFAQAMVASMGKAGLDISQNSSSSSSKVANIVFVCEYILGMPTISAIVVYVDSSTVAQSFTLGPCFSEQSVSTTMLLHKDTYMFVTPSTLKKYAPDLLSAESNPYEAELTNWLQELLEQTPAISGVVVAGSDKPAPSALESGASYEILGRFLGQRSGKAALAFVGSPSSVTVTISEWGPSGITFTVTGTGKVKSATPLVVTLADGTTTVDTQGFTYAGTS